MKTGSPPFRLVLLLLIPSLPLAAGCGSSSGYPVSQATGENQHADHDDDHDHDHHIAEHRPKSYADLVHELQSRPAVIRREADHDMDHARHELESLHDIISWLPEIAADTDLGQRDWDTASMTSRELMAIVPRSADEFVTAFQPSNRSASEYERCVARLSELIPLAESQLTASSVISTAIQGVD